MQSESVVRVSGRTELLMQLLFFSPSSRPAGAVIADGGAAAVLLTRGPEKCGIIVEVLNTSPLALVPLMINHHLLLPREGRGGTG
ncbi:unnamed protein product [Boreogadus saida]